MRIAVVEDDKADESLLCSYLERYSKENNITVNVSTFSDAIFFIDKNISDFDAVFMDIEMKHLNGYDACKRIREKDSKISIVFVTNLKQYALKGYQVEALDFLIKPINYSLLAQTMNRIKKKVVRDEQFVIIHNNDGIFQMQVKDITYLEILQHHVIYHFQDGHSISLWSSLKEEESKLPSEQFSYCNNCYYVSLAYVNKVDGDDVFVDNTKLRISRSKKKKFLADLSKIYI